MRTRASGESTLLLLDAVQILRAEKVDYAIVGAMAASVHGVIRASRDADALLSISTSALKGLEQSFKAAGFATELRRGDMTDPIGAVLTLHDEFENRVDLLVGLACLHARSNPGSLSTSRVPSIAAPARALSIRS